MRAWGLYSLGILFAKFYPGAVGVEIEPLDSRTAVFQPRRPMTEEDNAYYRGVANIDILSLFSRLGAYDEAFARNREEVILPTGERYQRMDQENYAQREIRFPKNVLFCDGKVRGFTCPSRERVYILVEKGYENRTVLEQWEAYYPHTGICPVEAPVTCAVMTRDGESLSTTVMVPACRKEAVPSILVRTPYGKEREIPFYERYVHRGYAVVIQDVRGRNESSGEWLPNYHEVEDGDDTLNWIAAQPWSDGKVGMIGGSYLGYVQWAAAASKNPHLTAMISVVCAGSAFGDLPRRGGTFASGMLAWAFSVSQKKFKPELMEQENWDEILNFRPLEEIPPKALGYEIPFLTEWFKHMEKDALWEKGDWKERGKGVQIPALIMSGWFDDNGMGTTEALDLTAGYPKGMRKVILGPWQHGGNSRYDIHGVPLGNNALMMDIDLTFLRWFGRHLKNEQNGADEIPPVQYYVLGDNEWRTAENWPIPDAEEVSCYLTSKGNANTSSGDGGLWFTKAPAEGADGYDYDPKDPALCVIDMAENEIGVPENYTDQDCRQDVLCYDTESLKEDMTITGDFTVELYVSSDTPDTDFVVRINDVDENGVSTKLADGVLSARFRNGFEKSEFMEPDQVYKIAIRTTKLSNTFRKGHKMRLTVTSSAQNWIFPNSNTREGFMGQETRVAHNVIHHGGKYPSRVIFRRERKLHRIT